MLICIYINVDLHSSCKGSMFLKNNNMGMLLFKWKAAYRVKNNLI